jgi:hypothetical protein
MIFVFGSARSGSTWLAKIFDSHPDLLYLHEPDISDRGVDLLPHWFENAPSPAIVERASQYLRRLEKIRNARTIGTDPFFRKSYRGGAAEVTHLSLVYGAKALERLGMGQVANSFHIPDLTAANQAPRLVVKSVSALGRAEAFLAAEKSMSPILLVRHPCGFVSSMLRGARRGVISRAERFGRLANTRSAVRLGLNRAVLIESDDVAFLAWTWMVSNAEAHSAVQHAKGSILSYDKIAADPLQHIRALFEKLQLGWPNQTEKFIRQSQQSEGDYYSVFRDSREASERWRNELDARAIDKIRGIVDRDPLGAQFFAR